MRLWGRAFLPILILLLSSSVVGQMKLEGDFDGNGSMDLVWHNQHTGVVSVWTMQGMSVLSGRPFIGVIGGQYIGPSDRIAAVAEMGGRGGHLDFVWQNASTGALEVVLICCGGFNVDTPIQLSPARVNDTAWKIKSAGDFNRDGETDLVWQHETDGRISVWFMNGLAQLSGVPLGPGQVPDTEWKIVGSGDFNRDGWRDLVWQHQADGRVAVWKMEGTVLVDGDLITPGQVADLDWKIRAVGDINGDGWPDLIWHHRVTGHVATWLMNGTTMISGVGIGQATDTNWQLVGPR